MKATEFHAAVLAELRAIRTILARNETAANDDGAQTRDAFGLRDATTGDPVPAPYQSTPTVGAVRGKYQPAAPTTLAEAMVPPRGKSRRK